MQTGTLEKPKKRHSRLLKRVSTRGGKPLYALKIRSQFGLSREELSRLIGYSVRSITSWENGAEITQSARKPLAELDRLFEGLAGIMREDSIPTWLQKNVPALDNQKPLEVIATGHIDWIWQLIYSLAGGVTS